MNKLCIFSLLLLCALVLVGGCDTAAEGNAKDKKLAGSKVNVGDLSDGIEEFIQARVEAIRKKDLAVLESTIHPACLVEIKKKMGSNFERALRNEMKFTFPKDFVIDPRFVGEDQKLVSADTMSYAVRPTFKVMLRKLTYKGKEKNLLWYIAKHNDAWHVVIPGPR